MRHTLLCSMFSIFYSDFFYYCALCLAFFNLDLFLCVFLLQVRVKKSKPNGCRRECYFVTRIAFGFGFGWWIRVRVWVVWNPHPLLSLHHRKTLTKRFTADLNCNTEIKHSKRNQPELVEENQQGSTAAPLREKPNDETTKSNRTCLWLIKTTPSRG
jgi:hypothetical protein